MKRWVTILVALAPFAASAQTIVIEPADDAAFRDIVESTIPPRYNGALIRWYTDLVLRAKAKADAMKANPEEPKPQNK